MLRSLKALHGYTVLAKDGDMGKVHDFYFHDDTWIVRYLVVDTGEWLPGRKVLVTPETILNSPEFHPDALVNRKYVERLDDYYGRPRYWDESGRAAETKE